LRFGVSAVLLGWIGWTTDWSNVAAAFAALRVEYWLAAVALLALTQLVSALRWELFARELRFTRTRRELVGMYFIGMFFNLMLPTAVGGDVVRAWYLDRGSGRKLAALASVFLDRLNGLLVLIALACTALVFSPIELPLWVPISVWGLAGGGVLAVAALPLAMRWGLVPAGRIRQVQTMLQALRAPRTLLWATGLSLAVQSANVGLVWLVAQALGAPIPGAYYWIFVPMVSLLTLLPVSVNGMGVREGGTVLLLAPLGIDSALAVTLAFLWFAAHVACSLLGGVVYLLGVSPPPASTNEEITHGPVDGGADQGRTGQLKRAA
jgi:uncharacterized membrane protein YbhN (UPF0104 family)